MNSVNGIWVEPPAKSQVGGGVTGGGERPGILALVVDPTNGGAQPGMLRSAQHPGFELIKRRYKHQETLR